MSDSERFWFYTLGNAQTGCVEWRGRTNGRYGLFTLVDRNILAHRYAYDEQVGPIPEGLEVDHLCDVKRCVRPDHLEPVTPAENKRRAAAAR
jgi:hypothetical protein